MEPSSSDLRYFLETVRLKSISAAAKSLGISQPSLSLAIKRIEKFLDEQILIRGRNGVILTTAGRSLIVNAQRLIDTWNDVRLQAQGTESLLNMRITIGCHPEVAIDSLPLFLPDILEENPKLDFILEHGLSRKLTEKVIAGDIDIGIVVNPKRHPALIIQHLSSDEVNFWTGPGKRMIQSPKSGKAVLFCDTDLIQSQTMIKRSEKKGFIFSRIIHTPDLEVVSSLIASGAGIGLLPSEVATRNPSLKLTQIIGVPGYADQVAVIIRYENRKAKPINFILSEIIKVHRKKYGAPSKN